MIAGCIGVGWKRVIATAVLIAFLSTSAIFPGTAWSAPVCASTRDMDALNTRVLQTELMVAALTCDQKNNYNTFATQFREPLVKHGRNLRALFRRAYGGTANKRLNAFVTKLANDASQRSMTLRQGYCEFAARLFNEAIETPDREFDRLLLKPWLRTRHGFRPCAG